MVYEMLTSRQAFGGATISDTIANVLGREIDWGTVPVSTPPNVQRLLRRCLDRDFRHRLHDIADARLDLDDADDSRGSSVTTQPGERRFPLWTTLSGFESLPPSHFHANAPSRSTTASCRFCFP